MPSLGPIVFTDQTTGSGNVRRWTRSLGTWNDTGATGTYTSVDDGVGTIADGDDGIGLLSGFNSSVTDAPRMRGLVMPSDFLAMLTLSVSYDSVNRGYTDDDGFVKLRLGSTTTTNFTDELTLCQSVGGTMSGIGTSQSQAFTLTATGLSASKSAWEAAFGFFSWSDTRQMGSDNATMIIVDLEFNGTYTATGGGAEPLNLNLLRVGK